MKWNNLKNSKCPKCGDYIRDGAKFVVCQSCDFKISPEKLQSIISYKSANTDNFEALQNDGREEVAEDFSDSPHLDY